MKTLPNPASGFEWAKIAYPNGGGAFYVQMPTDTSKWASYTPDRYYTMGMGSVSSRPFSNMDNYFTQQTGTSLLSMLRGAVSTGSTPQATTPSTTDSTTQASAPANSSDATQTTTSTPAADESGTVAALASEMPSLREKLLGQESWLNEKYNDYSSAVGTASSAYGNTLDSLISRMNDPNSQVSFGLAGSPSVSFTPQQTIRDIQTLEGLAANKMSNSLNQPTLDWNWQQQNPLYTGELNYFNIMSDLANRAEDRRYGIPTTTSTASYSAADPSTLTQLAQMASIFNTGLSAWDKLSALTGS